MGKSRRLVNYCFVLVCLLNIVLPEIAYSAVRKPVVRPASAQDVFVKGGQTLDIDRHWGEVIDVAGQTVNLPVTQKSAYNPTRIAGAIKQLIKNNPLKVAGTAAGVYLIHQLPGANFDPATGQPLITPDFQPTGTTWQINTWSGSFFGNYSSFKAGCDALRPTIPNYMTRVYDQSSGSNICRLRDNFSGYYETFGIGYPVLLNCPNGFNSQTASCNSSPITPAPMTDSQLDQLVAGVPGFSESHWAEIGPMLLNDVPATFDGPDSLGFTGPPSYEGQPTLTTTSKTNPDGSTSVDVSEKTTNYEFSYSPSPLSITTTTTTTTNNYTNGTQTSTTVVTDASPNPAPQPSTPEKDQKIDCAFMPTHCSWLEWTKQESSPEKFELPTHEVEQPTAVTVNVSASCPAPVVIDGGGIQGWTTFSIEFDVACDFLSTISPIVKGVCMMIAALILVWKP